MCLMGCVCLMVYVCVFDDGVCVCVFDDGVCLMLCLMCFDLMFVC